MKTYKAQIQLKTALSAIHSVSNLSKTFHSDREGTRQDNNIYNQY